VSPVLVSTLISRPWSSIGFVKFLCTSTVKALRGEIYKVCNLLLEILFSIKSSSDGKKPAKVFPPPVGATNNISKPFFECFNVSN
jgi:hypothetical protein